MTNYARLKVTENLEAIHVTNVRVNLDNLAGSAGNDLTFDQAHALADWIIANVPKTEPKPLPTKFAAVVKSDGQLYTLAALDVPIGGCRWIGADPIYGDWTAETTLQEQGFEVIFAGVEDGGVDD